MALMTVSFLLSAHIVDSCWENLFQDYLVHIVENH